MINPTELRLGNYVLYKSAGRITMVALTYQHFEALGKGAVADFFPVILKPEMFLKCGFIENKDYPLSPQAREFKLLLPLPGPNKNELIGYMKSNGECFVRASVNNTASSHNLFHLHSLQNLFFSLMGSELEVKK